MVTHLAKGYLNFSELMERWHISEFDLFHLISERKLFPSIFLKGNYDAYTFDQIELRWNLSYEKDELEYANDENERDDIYELINLRGFYYLRFQRESLDEISFSEVQENHPTSRNNKLMLMWQLEEESCNLKCGDKKFSNQNIVFIKEEIERYEREQKKIPANYSDKQSREVNPPENLIARELKKKLGEIQNQLSAYKAENDNLNKKLKQKNTELLEGKSKNTALQLIGGLVKSTYKMDIHSKKLNGLSEIVSDLEREGISITSETVSAWIKEAAQVIEKPKTK